LYVHTVPNGKRYIGMCTNPVKRWNNGNGYKDNSDFYFDIQLYGWNNIKHEIIKTFDYEEECHFYEMLYISLMNTETPELGYNRTEYKSDFVKMYHQKVEYDERNPKNVIDNPKNIFEEYGLSYDAGFHLISQWVFNSKHRQMAVDYFLDGLTYDSLSKKHSMSVRQCKNIIYEVKDRILKHI
jgi:hypothetical protein